MKIRLNIVFLAFGFTFNLIQAEVDKNIGQTKKQADNKIETEVKKEPKIEVIDEIKVRVNGVNITQSFLDKPQIVIGGQKLSLEDAITDELLFQKAVERQMLPNLPEVDKHIMNLKIHNNIAHLTEEEFEKELQEEGLSLQEYKAQMTRYIAVERLKGAEFNERVVVTTQEAEDYYKKNPSWSEEKYLLKICSVATELIDENGKLIKEDNLEWEELGWINKKDLSSNLSFVSNMKKGETGKAIKSEDSYQVVKVVDRSEKFLRSMDERYFEIEQVLHDQKKSEFERVFEKELRTDASIVYLT